MTDTEFLWVDRLIDKVRCWHEWAQNGTSPIDMGCVDVLAHEWEWLNNNRASVELVSLVAAGMHLIQQEPTAASIAIFLEHLQAMEAGHGCLSN